MLVRSWVEFYGKYAKGEINTLATRYPKENSLLVDYWALDRHSQGLAEHLLKKPTSVLFAAEKAVQEVPTALSAPMRLHVRIVNLPDHAAVRIRDLRSEHVGRLVAIDGLVRKASDVRPRVEDALFKCLRCDALVQEAQDEYLTLKEPLQCYDDQGGCGHSTGFKFMPEKSRFLNYASFEVQEPTDLLGGADAPQRLTFVAEDDLVAAGKVPRPGDRVLAVGILRTHPKRKGSAKTGVFEWHLQVVSLTTRRAAYEDVVISEDDEAKIRELASDPGIMEHLTASIAPSIFGMAEEKLAIALQLFGAVRKANPDGTTVRGDIHQGFIGDPGIAKTQLLRYAARLSLNGHYTDGTGSSGAGLTLGAVKDEDSGRFTYEAGPFVMAHGGLCAIDEADKMNKDDRARINLGMEQGIVRLTKTGLDIEAPSQCSVILAANPSEGRFDLKYASISDQVDIPPYLLSRLDLIWCLFDVVEAQRDRDLMTHVVFKSNTEPKIKPELLRKYIAYARRTCHPEVTPEAGRLIVEYYVDLRRRKAANPERVVVSSTPREGEAIRRLAQAAARVRLRDVVLAEDVEVARRLMDASLSRIPDGDIDKAIAGTGATKRDAIHTVVMLVADMEGSTDWGAPVGLVVKRAWDDHKIPEVRVKEIIERLQRDGDFWEPKTGHVKRQVTP